MDLINNLKSLGVDTDEALNRFMNNSSLYIRMLGKFTANAQSLEILPFIEDGDIDTAKENAHTLKGVTGNLSLTPLYNAYTEIMNCLRSDDIETATAILEKILPVQEQIIDCIEKNK